MDCFLIILEGRVQRHFIPGFLHQTVICAGLVVSLRPCQVFAEGHMHKLVIHSDWQRSTVNSKNVHVAQILDLKGDGLWLCCCKIVCVVMSQQSTNGH